MDRAMTASEIGYLVEHLSMSYSGTSMEPYLETGIPGTAVNPSGKPVMAFPLSEKSIDDGKVPFIDQLPVLFPCTENTEWYSREGSGIRFHHDILKSAFYLLSGYQEYHNEEVDEHGRFPWRLSVQHRLGFTGKPVVNYYFEIILEAYQLFCQANGLAFRRIPSENPVLFLSHDVDMLRKYTLRNMAYAGLQLLGLKPSTGSFRARWNNLLTYIRGILFSREDPYWIFTELASLEERLGITSTWYFLEKTRGDNSTYHFRDQPVRQLMAELASRGHEIGIHGTLESSRDKDRMAGEIHRINAVSEHPVQGIRQHYLRYSFPETTRIQEERGLVYDASLGFAEQVGFRHSFTHPFRLYDFERQRSFGIWQLPLQVMEVSLLGYMGVEPEQVPGMVRSLAGEVRKFNGILSILWHNSNLDEEVVPGINRVYEPVSYTHLRAHET